MTQNQLHQKLETIVTQLSSGQITRENASERMADMAIDSLMYADVRSRNKNVHENQTLPQGLNILELSKAIENIPENEKALRALSYQLGGSEHNYKNLLQTLQNVPTYRNYVKPVDSKLINNNLSDRDKQSFIREWYLADELRKE